MDLQIGETYHRRDELAAQGGTWPSGIITSEKNPYVFIITSERGRDFGYVDEFLEDGTFQYSGQGATGNMDWRFENEAIRDHKELGKEIHVFEKTEESYLVKYRGEYEYDDHDWVQLEDKNGDFRDAILFDLVPIGGRTISVTGDFETKPLEELYADACRAAPESTTSATSNGGHTPSSSSGSGSQKNRSEVVREFARRAANGECRGCEQKAPFKTEEDRPFLEVHHLELLGDEGADHPDNVIALCPNCHRRAHHGKNRHEFNETLKEKVQERSLTLADSA